MAESYEAVFWVRRMGAIGSFEQKWLTVPTDDRAAAIKAFKDLGLETRGGTIMPQSETTETASRL